MPRRVLILRRYSAPFFSRALEMRVADACDAQALEVKQGRG